MATINVSEETKALLEVKKNKHGGTWDETMAELAQIDLAQTLEVRPAKVELSDGEKDDLVNEIERRVIRAMNDELRATQPY